MAIPKKHVERVEKFITIVLTMVVKEELERVFYRKGSLDSNYTIAIYSNGLLPQYNDDTIEVTGDINGKKIGIFLLDGISMSLKTVETKLIKDIAQAYMSLRIKEKK